MFRKICASKIWCLGSEVWWRQLRRRLEDRTPWPSGPRWLAASGDFEADGVAAPRPERHRRVRFVGSLGEPHGVGESPSAPHPCHGPVGRLAQGQVSVPSRSHRYRSHRWRGSLGQLHRARIPPSLKHGRVWWAEVLGEDDGVEAAGSVKHGRVWWAEFLGKAEQVGGAGSGQPESRRWRGSDGQMVKDRTRGPLSHRGGVCQVRLSPAVPTGQGIVLVVEVGMPFAGTTVLRRLQDSTVQPGARPSEALRGVRKVGHAQGCRVRPHRASLAGDP